MMASESNLNRPADPPSKAEFDFARYLRKIDPGGLYTITRLSGGMVNLVVRATRRMGSVDVALKAGSQGPGLCEGSVVLKYAPPYVAALGPCVPFSQRRQGVEAAALRVLAENGAFFSEACVCTPRLVLEDKDEHVLVMSDLGEGLLSVDEWLKSRPALGLVRGVALRVGSFMGRLNDVSNAKCLMAFEEVTKDDLASTKSLVASVAVDKIGAYLADAGVEDADTLSERVKGAFEIEAVPGGTGVLCVGDFWTGSVLVSADGRRVGVIDWEFAGVGEPGLDMAQLLAHLHLQQMGSALGRGVDICVAAFVEEVSDAYQEQTWQCGVGWVRDERVRGEVMRAAYILHGREMINNAMERDFHVVEGLAENEQKKLQRAMIETGAWFVREAGKEVLQFHNYIGRLFRRADH